MIKILRFILFPFGLLYLLVSEGRNFLYKVKILKSSSFNLPVISVGNLSTGGTGKTPTTELIIRILLGQNKTIGFLSRGYGRKTLGFQLVESDSSSEKIGDEPLQIKKKFPMVEVAVCEKRVDGTIQLIKEKSNIKYLVLDDAFQHRAIQPSLSVLTSTFDEPFFADFILPIGNLRERRINSERADIILITKCPEHLIPEDFDFYRQIIRRYSNAKVFFSQIKYGHFVAVYHPEKRVENLTEKNMLLVTGIAKTDSLVSLLSSKYNLKHLAFPDHHHFSPKNINSIIELFNSFAAQEKVIVTTEKDAMRLHSIGEKEKGLLKNIPLYYLEMESVIIDGQEKFEKSIIDHVRKFK